MSAISDFPPVRYIGKGRWRLEDDFTYYTQYGKLVVPAGFETDFASVPPLPLSYTLLKNASVVAAAAHDYLYQTGQVAGRPITRRQADRIMAEIMVDEGVRGWKRFLISAGLRLGGWWVWRRYRREDDETEHGPF